MHDGTDDPIWEEPEYEPDPEEKAYEKWYEANHTNRFHRWKVRREGFRELLLSKGWHMRGAYAAKSIAGRETILCGGAEDDQDFVFVGLCLKHHVKRPNYEEW
jgi:hypothetical protein